MKETIWRAYKNVMLLGKDNTLKRVDLGLIHSSAATELLSLILTGCARRRLETMASAPAFLIRNWPPAFNEWTTKSVRDAFFASPLFPRLLSASSRKPLRAVSPTASWPTSARATAATSHFTFGRH